MNQKNLKKNQFQFFTKKTSLKSNQLLISRNTRKFYKQILVKCHSELKCVSRNKFSYLVDYSNKFFR